MNAPLTEEEMGFQIWRLVEASVRGATEDLIRAEAENASQLAGKAAWEREEEANYGGGMGRACPYNTERTETNVRDCRNHMLQWRAILEYSTKTFLTKKSELGHKN